MITGRFKDPLDPKTRLYGEVIFSHNDLLYVEVTRRNATPSEPYRTIVHESEFIVDNSANKGYWRRQLRGADGKWIEMGGGVEWSNAKGERKVGHVSGFDDEIQKVIVTDTEDNQYKLDADQLRAADVKAVLDDANDENSSETPTDTDTSDLEAFLDGESFDIADFTDEKAFPVGGPPLEIKDKQGNLVAKVSKREDPDTGEVSIILELLMAILPHELMGFLRKANQNA